MHKSKEFIGNDISKKVFDVWSEKWGYKQFKNTSEGFSAFLLLLTSQSWCVMEFTGSYYHQLALFLHDNDVAVSVVNPLVIKRFIQMKLQHNKTDKSDARMIVRYAKEQPLSLWKPQPQYIRDCKDLHTVISLYHKQRTALKNKLHSFVDQGLKGKVVTSVKRHIRQLDAEIKLLESQLETIIKTHEQELLSNLLSIPGLGRKTAILLIVCTNGFKTFENSRQLSAFFGLSPVIRASGSSVRGKTRISKRGNPMVRNHLFMCSFTAYSKNHQCKALYERIVNKGKSKKLALIAVTNKLLAQSLAIAKSGVRYDPDFKSVNPSNNFSF
ncbi:IS110 family transposase [uncultured Draconibacterium sp.]|uniref:IS110 family transposase n=1 Tax=uncultured Draconibacterium sp. TaxID=1573823 RepID=UPI0032176545